MIVWQEDQLTQRYQELRQSQRRLRRLARVYAIIGLGIAFLIAALVLYVLLFGTRGLL